MMIWLIKFKTSSMIKTNERIPARKTHGNAAGRTKSGRKLKEKED